MTLKPRRLGVVLSLAFLMVFAPAILFNQLPEYMDTVCYFFPLRVLAGRMLMQGELPLWNPCYCGGAPLLANPQLGLLYPGNFLFYLFPLAGVFTLLFVLHIIAAGWGSFLWISRRLGDESLGIVALAVTMFGGWQFAHFAFGSYLFSFALIPWFLYCWEREKVEPQRTTRAIAGVILGLVILTGAPQLSFYLLGALLVFLICEGVCAQRGQWWQGIRFFIIAYLIGLGIAAPQWISSLGAAGEMTRQGTLALERVTAGSMQLKEVWLAFCGGLGLPEEPEATVYVGFAGFSLLLMGIFSRGMKRQLSMLIVLVVCLLLVLKPLAAAYYQALPFYAYFHDPRRMMTVTFLFAIPFIALGVRELGKPKMRVAFSVLLLLNFVTSRLLVQGAVSGNLTENLGWQLPWSWQWAGVIVGLGVMVASWRLKLPTLGSIMALLLMLDLFHFASSRIELRFRGERELFSSANLPAGDETRYVSYDAGIAYSYYFRRPHFGDWLFPNLGAYYGYEDFQGYDPWLPRRYTDYMRLINEGMVQLYPAHFGLVRNLDSPLLRRAGVSYLIGDVHWYYPFAPSFVLEEETKEIPLEGKQRRVEGLKIIAALLSPRDLTMGEEIMEVVFRSQGEITHRVSIRVGELGYYDRLPARRSRGWRLKQLGDSYLYAGEYQFPAPVECQVLELRVLKPGGSIFVDAVAVKGWESEFTVLPVGVSTDVEGGIYKLMRAFPRVHGAERVYRAHNKEEAARVLREIGGEAKSTVVVESSDALSLEYEVGEVREWKQTNNSVEIKVRQHQGKGLLVIRNAYSRGWSAMVDGQETHLYPADMMFQGVEVPEGEHTVLLSYRARGFLPGVGLLAFTIILVVLSCKPPFCPSAEEDGGNTHGA